MAARGRDPRGGRDLELIPRLRDVRARKLLTLQRLGVADARIATQLDVSVANVQTIRSRALKELRGLIDS